jgi:molybdopterin-guanine dinucleotide biosynthesis protein A
MMDAVLLAGGIPQPDESLFSESSGRSKALIDVAGKPMVQWVLDAIDGCESIQRISLIGLDSASGLTSGKPLSYLPDSGSLLSNIVQGLEHVREQSPGTTHILLASTDIPAITTEVVDWRISAANKTEIDVDYVVVERQTMEARFPESKRSFVRLRDVEVCGGDLNIIRVDLAEKTEIWERLVAARKNAFRQAALLGYDLLIRLLTRQITLQAAEQKVSQRLGLRGRAVISPYAELAMDVDKPEQLAILRKDLTTGVLTA